MISNFCDGKGTKIFWNVQINKNKIKQNFSKLFFLETIWNVRSAIGTGSGLGTPARLSAVLVLFVGSRYYLRPNPLLNRPQESWNAPWRYWTARKALSGYSCITQARVCDGNAMSVR